MNQYETSAAQQAYLRKMHSQKREAEGTCDCPGCDKCTGFVRNCECDLLSMAEVKAIRDAAKRT